MKFSKSEKILFGTNDLSSSNQNECRYEQKPSLPQEAFSAVAAKQDNHCCPPPSGDRDRYPGTHGECRHQL